MTFNKPSLRILFILFITGFISCKNQNSPVDSSGKEETPALKSLSNQELTALYAATEKVDMIFYDLPISVNQEDAPSAKNSVLYVSPSAAVMNPACKPAGRLTFVSQGAIYKEADFYFGQGCNYFVFMEKNQPVAVNAMAESGTEFFKRLIDQVQEKTQ